MNAPSESWGRFLFVYAIEIPIYFSNYVTVNNVFAHMYDIVKRVALRYY